MHLVNSKLNYVYFCGAIKLLPGINTVSNSDFEKLKTHSLFKKRLNSKTFEVNEQKVNRELRTEDVEIEFKNLSVKQVKEIIAGTIDPIKLKKISTEDDRPRVIEAAKERLDFLLKDKK